MKTTKLTRAPLIGTTEYQLEHKPSAKRGKTEYRVRRGTRGTWTRWFETNNKTLLLANLGFNGTEPTWLTDFYFESYFGRGEIKINLPMFKQIARRAGYQPLNTYLYARLKQVEPELWVLPASALENNAPCFEHLRDIIEAHL